MRPQSRRELKEASVRTGISTGLAVLMFVGLGAAQEFHPDIPRAWDDQGGMDSGRQKSFEDDISFIPALGGTLGGTWRSLDSVQSGISRKHSPGIRCCGYSITSTLTYSSDRAPASSTPRTFPLIGVQDLKYLDATGLVHHRSIGDLMRHAIIKQGLDTLARYGDFQPSSRGTLFSSEAGTRYSDEQLYAMALYIYSLKPPPNPNAVDDRARRGQLIFEQQGCAGCHTPPLYTNDKLTPVQGFKIPRGPSEIRGYFECLSGFRSGARLKTRRATGFYKVPSLRGVWYRNAFGHSGLAETLEEWFDPAR